MKYLVSGGNGFIGRHFVNFLLENEECSIVVYDNFSVGKDYISQLDSSRVSLVNGDMSEFDKLTNSLKGIDAVFHMAAYSDTKASVNAREVTFNNGFDATKNLLEAMVKMGVKYLVFTSSQLVYGNIEDNILINENQGPLLPNSIFGASKLSCEALISAYSQLFGITSRICRLSNIIGDGMSRGIIYDFINKLKDNPEYLNILGDGRQERSYLFIDDCAEAIYKAYQNKSDIKCDIVNVGNKDTLSAYRIAEIVIESLGLTNNTEVYTESKQQGWQGDVPRLRLCINKMEHLGWTPKFNSENAVRETVSRLLQ